ncbi:cupredoxin domain-containing protein [Nitrospira sp. Nam74]
MFRSQLPARWNPVIPFLGIILCLCLASFVACDAPRQTVFLTAEDYRFVPDFVQVKASSPLRLSVYNAGREVHEFDSPILTYAAETPPSRATDEPADSSPTILRPGQSLRIVLAPPPGTYLYSCRRKGHANMAGTLIVD